VGALQVAVERTREQLGPMPDVIGGLVQHPPRRDLASPAGRVGGEDRLEGRNLHLVDADGPRDGVAAESRDELGTPEHDTGLRPSEELVPGEHDEVGAVREGVCGRRLVGGETRASFQESRPEVVDERNAGLVRDRREIGGGRVGGEPHHAVVARVDLQDDRGLLGERGPEVRDARPVGRPHLDEMGTGCRHEVRDPDLSADLDELAP
jgi:hypothetical protein